MNADTVRAEHEYRTDRLKGFPRRRRIDLAAGGGTGRGWQFLIRFRRPEGHAVAARTSAPTPTPLPRRT